MAWLTFLALLFIGGVTQAQSAAGSMILAEGFRVPEHVQCYDELFFRFREVEIE